MHIKELERLQTVNRFLTLKISKEDELTKIARFAADLCGVPIALITLVDRDTQCFKYSVGANIEQSALGDAFCSTLMKQNEPLVIPDTTLDERFKDNDFNKSPHNIRFYAGVPMITSDGLNLGSLCVLGHQPGNLTSHQLTMLKILSKQVIHIFEFDYSLEILKNQYLEAKVSEIKLRALFESASSSHLLLDKNLNILFFNKALSEFITHNLGQEMKEGDAIVDYVQEAYKEEFLQYINMALNGIPTHRELELNYLGTPSWWQISYNPAYNEDAKIIGVSYNATNVTDLKISQQQTLEREQLLNAFAYMQAHQVRGPVSSILGMMGIIKDNDYKADREELQVIEKAILELDVKIQALIKSATVK